MIQTLAAVPTVAVLAALALTGIFPSVSTTIILVSQIVALLLCVVPAMRSAMAPTPGVVMPILAGILLTIAFTITAQSPMDAIGALVFAPIYLVAPLLAAFRIGRMSVTLERLSLVAALGTAGALGLALYDSLVLGTQRAGALAANPIHFADACIVLALIGMIGLFGRPGRRWIGLVAPLLAIAAVVLSGTRGAMVAMVPLALTGIGLTVIWNRISPLRWLLILAGIGAGFCLVLLLHAAGWPPVVRIGNTLAALLSGSAVTDASDSERMIMLAAGWHAFTGSPLYGIGVVDFGRRALAAYPHAGPVLGYDHLHNDVADVATVGGAMGLLAYGLFIAAPVVEALRAPPGPGKRAALFLGLMLAVAYFVLGLTNAVLGVLLLTTLFGIGTTIVSHLARTPGLLVTPAPAGERPGRSRLW